MKKYAVYFTAVLLILWLGLLYSADTHVEVPTIVNQYGDAYVSLSVTMGSDSTGSRHSDAIFIGNVNANDAYVQAVTNAAADINIIFHYSNDLANWQAITATGLDALSNTAKYDTLGIGDQAPYHKYRWLVVEADGQTGTNQTDIAYIRIDFEPDADVVLPNGQPPKFMFSVINNATDP
jgi:hypothetical protein